MKTISIIITIWLATSTVFAIWWWYLFGSNDTDYTIKENDIHNDSDKL